MAKVSNPPAELPAPTPDYKNYDFKKEQAREEAWEKSLAGWCRKNGNGDTAGKVVRTHVADSFACYMVFTEKPLQLIHMPLGDAWSAGKVWERGLRLSDVRQMVARSEGMASIFAKK